MRGLALSGLLLLVSCLTDFPPVPDDAATTDGRPDAAATDGVADAQGDIPDAPPPTCNNAWSLWSGSASGSGCSATCPATGDTQLTLTCNKINCTCGNGTKSQQCSSPGTACGDCRTAFGSGCCDGL
ncbi:MAG: hypothetical protein JRI55_40920 [Deltaproteobacteria bacterium]|jgi:hypothetical protein|nr:hypothetical protein [Deltaproteobacteria bacterium]